MSEDETTAGVLFVRERTSPRQYRCSCFAENKERGRVGEREMNSNSLDARDVFHVIRITCARRACLFVLELASGDSFQVFQLTITLSVSWE